MKNERLRTARKERRWTIEEASARIGVSRTTYIRWEQGTQKPQDLLLTWACKAFNMTAEQLGFAAWPGQTAEAEPQETAVAPIAGLTGQVEPGSMLLRLTRAQAERIAALLDLRGDTMTAFDPSKRETLKELRKLLAAAGVATIGTQFANPELWERLSKAHTMPSALNSATLDRFEHLLGEGWELSNINELEAAEGILSSFLPKIIAVPSHEVHAKIAYLASQGLRLQSVLVHHRLRISNKVLICQQAVDYARCANDTNTLVTALIELAAAYKFEGQLEKRLSALQEALSYSVHASPLVQSRAYSNSASALAESGRIQEAQCYIKLARDVFPDDPTGDPGFALADSSIFTLSYHAGKVYAAAGRVAEAFDAFELYQQHSPGVTIPERIRLEIVNAQSRVALQARDLERYGHCFESALVGALALGSKKRFDEAITIFRREMPKTWLENGRIKGIAEQYHLENEG